MSNETAGEIEIYSMASFPTIVVSDIQASAAWYCGALSFTYVFTMPGPDGYRLVFNGPRLDGEQRCFEEIIASAAGGLKLRTVKANDYEKSQHTAGASPGINLAA